MHVLFEAIGSPGWPTLLPWLRASFQRISALEIDESLTDSSLVDRCLQVMPYADLEEPDVLIRLCERESIDIVFPSVDEGLLVWDSLRAPLSERGTRVVLSPKRTIEIFGDKWETYQFFRDHEIPTPRTSLQHDYELVKPRNGRGGDGIRRARATGAPLAEEISQELARGQELSVDLLVSPEGELIRCVQRERLEVWSGVCVRGRVVQHAVVDALVQRIIRATPFVGFANLQCFVDGDDVEFIEVNTRIPGGLSLSLAATDNWFDCWLKLQAAQSIRPARIQHGLRMRRHYADQFIPAVPGTAR